jgi:L-ascorbate metabolism protein UlaG (beta-lactamase superfamily)
VGDAVALAKRPERSSGPSSWGTFPVLQGKPAELQQALHKRGVKARMIEMKVGETRSF